jgi:hypothetical protein
MSTRPRSARRDPIVLEFHSDLAHSADAVWETIATMAGVNAELGPYVRMTHPRALPAVADVEFVPGEVLFHSWVLLFGVVPFDRHAFAFERVTVGSEFVEESTSWLHRRWRHERVVSGGPGGGSVVSDRLTIEPRIPATAPIERRVVRALFDHRHKRLRAARFAPAR